MTNRLFSISTATFCSSLLLAAGSTIAGAADAKPKTIVELFTSQGCSSCPPADAILGELAKRDDVVAVTMPVDYWDYLGWKDTFGSPAFSARQRGYAQKRGDGNVYTPQLVVNGIAHAVGSRPSDIETAISTTDGIIGPEKVMIAAHPEGSELVVEVGAEAPNGKDYKATLWLASIKREGDVKIKGGENSGLKAAYYNIVRGLTAVGPWTGKAASYHIKAKDLGKTDGDAYVLLLQADDLGVMLGGLQVADWRTN